MNMRELLIAILKDLKNLTGSNQYEQIASLPTEEQAQAALNNLLNPMLNICANYAYIQDETKAKVIRKKIIEDTEFFGLNAQKINRYLNSVAHIYYWESHHVETREILDNKAEDLSEETLSMIEEYKAQLLTGFGIKQINGVKEEMKSIAREDEVRQFKQRSVGAHPSLSEMEVKKRQLHTQWIKENFDPITGKPLPNSNFEEAWLFEKGYELKDGHLKEI